MLRSRPIIGLLLVTSVGCGPPIDVATEVSVPTCGGDGPSRLLPDVVMGDVVSAAGRLVMVVQRVTPPDDETGLAHYGSPFVVSVGECGEEPTELLPGEVGGQADHRMVIPLGDLLLACDEAGIVHRLDPEGVERAQLLTTVDSCQFVPTSAGVVAHASGNLVLFHWHGWEAGADAEILAHDVGSACTGLCDDALTREPAFRVVQERVFYVDDGDLVQVDLAGNATVVAVGVSWLDAPLGGDRIVFAAASPGTSEEQVSSLDPGSAAMIELGRRDEVEIAWPLAVIRRAGHVTAVDVRDGSEVSLPPGDLHAVLAPTDEHHGTFVSLGTAPDDTARSIHRWSDERRRWVDLGTFEGCVEVRETFGSLALAVSDCEGPADVLLVDPETGEAALAARDVAGQWIVMDGRVVWSTERGEPPHRDIYGELLVAEPGSATRWRIDREARVATQVVAELDGDFLYEVVDVPRTGVWRSAQP